MAHLSHIVLALTILYNVVARTACSADLYNDLAQQLTSLQAQVDALSQRLSSSHSTCVGHVSSNEFQPYIPKGIVAYVDTSRCQFHSTPIYLTSLRGNANHWQAVGMSSVYVPTSNSFQIYLSFVEPAGRNTTNLLDWAAQYKWELDWVGMERL